MRKLRSVTIYQRSFVIQPHRRVGEHQVAAQVNSETQPSPIENNVKRNGGTFRSG